MDGNGVEHDFTDTVVVTVLHETDIQFAGVVARVGVLRHLVGIALDIKHPGDLDKIGVGIGIEEAVYDGHLLIVSIEVDVGRASPEKACPRQAKDYQEPIHSVSISSFTLQ